MAFREDIGTLAPARRLDDGRLVVEGTFGRSGVQTYYNADGSTRIEYRPPEQVFSRQSMDTLALVPVTDDHPPVAVTSANAAQYTVGQVGEAIRQDGIHLVGKIVVNTAAMVKKMDSGKRQLSCGYDCDLVMQAGVTPAGERYDAVQTNIVYNHLAIVDAGRAGSAKVRMDALRLTSRFDAMAAVQAHAVALINENPSGVSTYVYSTDMTSDNLLSAIASALVGIAGITVTMGEMGELIRFDSAGGVRVGRTDASVRAGTAYGVSVRVSSTTMTADQLNTTLSAALSASPDFHVRTDSSQENIRMNELEKALKRIDELTRELGAEKQRADHAEAKQKEHKDAKQAAEAKQTEAEAKLANETKRADEAATKLTESEKVRTDAASTFDARVSARATLLAQAGKFLARNDKGETLSVDGKSVLKLDTLNDRALRTAIVHKLDGMEIPADRSDETVQFVCDSAIARAEKSGAVIGGARQIVMAGNLTQDAAVDGDLEAKAKARMDASSKDAWKQTGGVLTADKDPE